MSKVTVALGAFILGACTMLLLSGNHTSMLAQSRITGRPGLSNALSVPDAVPVVPNAIAHFSDVEIEVDDQQIDGLDCLRCTLKTPVLTYGGGPFRFSDSRISGPVRIILKGAAANTVVFLSLVQGTNLVKPPQPSKPNAPILKVANTTEPITFSLESPYGLK
jgi:hypothetical protein